MKDEQSGVAKLATLTEEEEREFWRLYRFYWREAERCEEAKAYLAGCVMLGSALEALLILMVDVYDEQAAATGKVPIRRKTPKPLLDWDLGELLRVGHAVGSGIINFLIFAVEEIPAPMLLPGEPKRYPGPEIVEVDDHLFCLIAARSEVPTGLFGNHNYADVGRVAEAVETWTRAIRKAYEDELRTAGLH